MDMVVGEIFAHIGYALAPKAEEYKMPTIFPVIAADDLTQRKPSKWVVRLGWTGSQPSHPFGEYAAKTLGYKKVAVFGTDYAFGYEVVGGFQRSFEEAGGQIDPEALGPARHQRPRPVHHPDQARRGRGLHHRGRGLRAALPRPVPGRGPARAGSR